MVSIVQNVTVDDNDGRSQKLLNLGWFALSRLWLIFVLFLLLANAVNAATAIDAQRRLAGSPAISKSQCWQLTQNRAWTVRQALARNRRCPVAVLARLARDPSVQVRIAVATNLATTEQTFLRLAHDADANVRSVVARFEYVPVSALAILAQDRDADIRLEVARNLNADQRILQRLVHDPQPEVANAASVGIQRLADKAGRN